MQLRAVVDWQYDLPLGEGFDGLATLVHLKDGDGEVMETREVAWPDNSLELELSPSLPWATRISLQTSVLDSALGESDGDRQLFGGETEMKLVPPKEESVKVEHREKDGELEAVITWENNMDKVFDHLQTVVEVTDRESYLTKTKVVDYSANSVVISLAEVQAWASNFTIHTAVMGGRGEATKEQPLFADLPLSLPENVQVDLVVEDGAVEALVTWNNTVMDGALTSEEFSTEVKLLDKEDNILEKITVVYPEIGFNKTLGNLPWDVRFMLTTTGKEEEGESSQPKALFADNLELEAPKDIRLKHKVENNVMSASLSWDSVHQLFDRLVTVVQLYDNEGELYDLPRYLPAGETRSIPGSWVPNKKLQQNLFYLLLPALRSSTENLGL